MGKIREYQPVPFLQLFMFQGNSRSRLYASIAYLLARDLEGIRQITVQRQTPLLSPSQYVLAKPQRLPVTVQWHQLWVFQSLAGVKRGPMVGSLLPAC